MKLVLYILCICIPLLAQRPPAGGQISGVSGTGPYAVTTVGAQTSGACVQIDANGNHIANPSGLGCAGPVAATSSSLGTVQPDGTIITVAAGLITVPKSSPTVFGVAKVDNTTIASTAGVLSVVSYPLVRISTALTGQVANASLQTVLTYTPAAVGTFQVGLVGTPTALSGSGVAAIAVVWTDDANAAHTQTFINLNTVGTASQGAPMIRAKAGVAINVTATLTGTSNTYNLAAVITQLGN